MREQCPKRDTGVRATAFRSPAVESVSQIDACQARNKAEQLAPVAKDAIRSGDSRLQLEQTDRRKHDSRRQRRQRLLQESFHVVKSRDDGFGGHDFVSDAGT